MTCDIVQTLHKQETALHKEEVRECAREIETCLSDEFVEFGNSGKIFNKSEIIKALCGATPHRRAEVQDFKSSRLADGPELVTYTSMVILHGAQIRTLRSSIWERRGEDWRMRFHQGTPIS